MFWVFYLADNQAYKLKLFWWWKIYIVFYVSLQKQNMRKNWQVDENENGMKLNADNNNKKYKVKTIWDSAIYTKKLAKDYLSEFYYLVS